MASVKLKNVTKFYSDQYGLIDFDCEIKSGEFISVIGESGSGKTTFLKIISGLLMLDCGELYINDKLMNEVPPQNRNVAMMFQEYSLYPNYNVFENVAAYLKFNKVDINTINTRVMNVLKIFGIDNLANRRIKELSGGQKQRVALAKLFVREPDVLLLDEPLSNVDEQHKNEYIENILALKELMPKTTFIYVTHNIGEAMRVGQRVLVIEKGRNVSFASPRATIEFPKNLSVRRYFMGEEETFESAIDINNNDIFDEFYFSSIGNSSDNVTIVKQKAFKHLAYASEGNLIGGATEVLKLPAILRGNKLIFDTFEFNLSDDIKMRLLNKEKEVFVSFDLNKFHLDKFYNDIPLKLNLINKHDVYNLIEFDNKKFIVYSSNNILDCPVYYDINELQISDLNGNKILANYKIYTNEINCLVIKQFIKQNLKNKKVGNKITLPYESIIGLTNKKRKNTIKLIRIISEEIISEDKKLVYAFVSGCPSYISFIIGANQNINYKKNSFIIIDPTKIIL